MALPGESYTLTGLDRVVAPFHLQVPTSLSCRIVPMRSDPVPDVDGRFSD